MLPIFLLVASFFSVFFKYTVYFYVIAGNTVGYSITTNLFFILYFSTNKNNCFITRISPIGLLAINIVDIIGFYFDDNFYNFWYVVTVCSCVFVLSFIHLVNRLMR